MPRSRWNVGLLAAALATAASCSRQHVVAPAPDPFVDPGQPGGLGAEIGNGQVTLRWTIADPSPVSLYRVYRRSESEAAFRQVASATATAATLTGLQNGVLYLFQVAAVSAAGIEGRRSESLAVRPSTFNVTINAGAPFANGLGVTLSLSAPAGTVQMVVSNQASFPDSAVFDFSTTRAWSLAGGADGARTVHVRFRDAAGNTGLASDDIVLDRIAEISSVTENSGGTVKNPGQTVRFELTSGEPNGTATVDVGSAKIGLRLFDDGTHGDTAAGDGFYTLDYVIEPGVDANAATVTGRFTDPAGNSTSRAATTLLTIQSPPPMVSLTAVLPASTSALNVFWGQSAASDFASYRLWRAESSDVLVAPTRAVVSTATNRSTTSFQDTGLKEDFTYYYLLEVVDQNGLATASPALSGTTLNDFPAPVVLDTVVTVGTDRVLLTWSRSPATDFASYRVYQSTVPGADTTRTLAATVTSQSVTFRDLTGLAASTTYYYRVYVVDRSGRQVPSNEVAARTKP